LFTSDPAVIADGSLLPAGDRAHARSGRRFEIHPGGRAGRSRLTPSWPQTVSTLLTLARVPLRRTWWSGTIGLLGIWLALSLTAIARGGGDDVVLARRRLGDASRVSDARRDAFRQFEHDGWERVAERYAARAIVDVAIREPALRGRWRGTGRARATPARRGVRFQATWRRPRPHWARAPPGLDFSTAP